jgi:maltooligosyltrehalose trehalohydrolase
LQRLVNACHAQSLAIFLDVVYNHVGPEGAYFEEFGLYFTDCYHTPGGRPSITTTGAATRCGRLY